MRFWAILCFAFATLTMAAAPALAAQAALPQPAMSQDCHDSGTTKDTAPSHDNGAKDMPKDMPKDMKACLALCMIAQGVMMPRANEPIAAAREPLERPSMTLSAQLHSLAAGIDPPPPRI